MAAVAATAAAAFRVQLRVFVSNSKAISCRKLKFSIYFCRSSYFVFSFSFIFVFIFLWHRISFCFLFRFYPFFLIHYILFKLQCMRRRQR